MSKRRITRLCGFRVSLFMAVDMNIGRWAGMSSVGLGSSRPAQRHGYYDMEHRQSTSNIASIHRSVSLLFPPFRNTCLFPPIPQHFLPAIFISRLFFEAQYRSKQGKYACCVLDYSARLHLVISDMYHKTHVVKIAEKKVLPLSVLSNTAAHITILNSQLNDNDTSRQHRHQ